MPEMDIRLVTATAEYVATAVFPDGEPPEVVAWKGRFFVATAQRLTYRECQIALVTKTRES